MFTLSSCLSIIGIEDLIIDKVTCCGFFKYAFITLFKKIMFILSSCLNIVGIEHLILHYMLDFFNVTFNPIIWNVPSLV